MKTMLTVVLAGALMSAVCIGFAACDESGEKAPEQQEERTEVEIKPVPVEEISDEVSAFFDRNVRLIVQTFSGKDEDEYDAFIDRCLVFNSVEELSKVAFDGKFPDVDFNSYTLVVGQRAAGGALELMSQYLVVEQDVVTLNLILGHETEGGIYTDDIWYKPFWGLYHKVTETKSININVTIKD